MGYAKLVRFLRWVIQAEQGSALLHDGQDCRNRAQVAAQGERQHRARQFVESLYIQRKRIFGWSARDALQGALNGQERAGAIAVAERLADLLVGQTTRPQS
jgi:hypothetical protein